VLAGLLLSANEVVTVDRLVGIVWGEAPPPSAEANLRNHVARLRRHLAGDDGERVLARSGGYMIVVRRAELDLRAFADAAAQGRQAMRVGQQDIGMRRLEDALALWHGEPLENVTLFGGAAADVIRLREARLGVLEDYLQAKLTAGWYADVISELRGLTIEHPLREHLWALLMLALAGAGQQAAALDSYATIRDRLAEDLGVEPGARLQDAHLRVLRQDVSADWPA
jgi:DNA-binding SARP family transcriptional activator